MAQPFVAITLVSDTVTPALRQLQAHVQDTAPAFADIATVLHRSTLRNFTEEGRPQKWAPLSPATAEGMITKKHKRGYANILHPTGQLIMRRIATKSGNGFAQVGAMGIVPAVHQFGTNRAGRGRRTKIPRRPFIGRSDASPTEFSLVREDEQSIEKIIAKHIERGQQVGQ